MPKIISSPVAASIPFDNSDTSFLSTDLQSAVVEARSLGDFQIESENSETSTTSTTVFSTKLTLTTGSLLTGDYRLGWALKWRAANANRGIRIRIQQDGVTIKEYVLFSANVNESPFTSAFAHISGLSAGPHTFTLEFRVGIGATTVYVSEATMEFWRTE